MNRELRIAPTVGFESLFSAVEGAAVDLDDEALADQEIDVPDTGESDLLARPNSESTKSKKHDGFGDGLRDAVCLIQQCLQSRWKHSIARRHSLREITQVRSAESAAATTRSGLWHRAIDTKHCSGDSIARGLASGEPQCTTVFERTCASRWRGLCSVRSRDV